MLHWFRRLLPRQLGFFPLFERHAFVIVGAAIALREMLTGNDLPIRYYEEIIAKEHEADEIAREVLIGLRSTFITPFDRADIQSLITSMDDSIDQMHQTAKAIVLFEMTTFDTEMRTMADAILECAELAERAISMLSDVGRNASELNDICLAITRIEGDADDMHTRGLERLFQQAKSGNAMDFIRGNEIYNHLEKAVDRLEDVADEIQGIVIEHA
jgi:predicted phosphate transport protein (TIGR00153 family)